MCGGGGGIGMRCMGVRGWGVGGRGGRVGGWFIRGRCAYLPRVFPLVPALSADVVVLGFTPPQKETQKGEGEGRLEVGDKQASPCPRHPQGVAVAC